MFLAIEPQEGSMSAILDFSSIAMDSILHSDRPHKINRENFTFHNHHCGRYHLVRLGVQFRELIESVSIELVLMTDDRGASVAENYHMHNLCLMMMIISRHPQMLTEKMWLSLLEQGHNIVAVVINPDIIESVTHCLLHT